MLSLSHVKKEKIHIHKVRKENGRERMKTEGNEKEERKREKEERKMNRKNSIEKFIIQTKWFFMHQPSSLSLFPSLKIGEKKETSEEEEKGGERLQIILTHHFFSATFDQLWEWKK